MVDKVREKYKGALKEKGIAFDHSYVNIAWRKNTPVPLEIHKCQREYLFNYCACFNYIKSIKEGTAKQNSLLILQKIKELTEK